MVLILDTGSFYFAHRQGHAEFRSTVNTVEKAKTVAPSTNDSNNNRVFLPKPN